MNLDLVKNANDILELETDKSKRKEVQESDKYEQWTKKKIEIISYCSKNYDQSLNVKKECPDFELLMEELERDHDLYQSDY